MSFKRKLERHANPKTKDLYRVNRKTPFWKAFLLMTPALLILIVFTVVPFIFAVRDGIFVNDNDAYDTAPSFHNFKTVLEDPFFHQALKNSLLYAIIAVPLILIISLVISSAISSVIRKRLRGIIQTIFFLPYVTSAISISLAFAFLFDYDTGMINGIITAAGGKKMQFTNDSTGHGAMIVMVAFGVWRGLAFNILIFTTAMLAVDKTRYKAAAIDGSGPVKQFFKITIPSINGTINFLVTMGIIGAIKVFPLALFDNNPSTAKVNGAFTLMLYVYDQINVPNFGKAGVASIYILIISISFSVIVKGGFNQIIKLTNYLGEKRVANKIKNY